MANKARIPALPILPSPSPFIPIPEAPLPPGIQQALINQTRSLWRMFAPIGMHSLENVRDEKEEHGAMMDKGFIVLGMCTFRGEVPRADLHYVRY